MNNPLSTQFGEKPVTVVPGIGPAAQHAMGITRASQLLGMYLQNPLNFQSLLMGTYGVYANNAGLAYNALREFSNTHIF